MCVFLPCLNPRQLAKFSQLNRTCNKWLDPKTGINAKVLYATWGYKLNKEEEAWSKQSISTTLTCNWWQTTIRKFEHVCAKTDKAKLQSEAIPDPR